MPLWGPKSSRERAGYVAERDSHGSYDVVRVPDDLVRGEPQHPPSACDETVVACPITFVVAERGVVETTVHLDQDLRVPVDQLDPADPTVCVADVDLACRSGEARVAEESQHLPLELARRCDVAVAASFEERPCECAPRAPVLGEIVEHSPTGRDRDEASSETMVERTLCTSRLDAAAEIEHSSCDRCDWDLIDHAGVVLREHSNVMDLHADEQRSATTRDHQLHVISAEPRERVHRSRSSVRRARIASGSECRGQDLRPPRPGRSRHEVDPRKHREEATRVDPVSDRFRGGSECQELRSSDHAVPARRMRDDSVIEWGGHGGPGEPHHSFS